MERPYRLPADAKFIYQKAKSKLLSLVLIEYQRLCDFRSASADIMVSRCGKTVSPTSQLTPSSMFENLFTEK